MEKKADATALITVAEAARRLAVCTRQMRNLIKDGALMAVNVGTGERPAYRLRPVDLEKFIESRLQCGQPAIKAPKRAAQPRRRARAPEYEIINFQALRAQRRARR